MHKCIKIFVFIKKRNRCVNNIDIKINPNTKTVTIVLYKVITLMFTDFQT